MAFEMKSDLNQIRSRSERILWSFTRRERESWCERPAGVVDVTFERLPRLRRLNSCEWEWITSNKKGSFQSSHNHALPHKSETGLRRLSLAAGEGDCAKGNLSGPVALRLANQSFGFGYSTPSLFWISAWKWIEAEPTRTSASAASFGPVPPTLHPPYSNKRRLIQLIDFHSVLATTL